MPEKYALLIGNSAFRHAALARLAAPPNDVRDLAGLLEDEGVAGFQVRLMLDTSLVDAKAAIGELFANRRPDDLVLFYYSGHGLRDAVGEFYLALTESDPLNPDPGSIDESWLRRKMNASASRRQVLILDCCHSGALIPDGLIARRATGPVLTERTLDPSGHGRFILAATTADASAFEQDGRSIYTRHLVEGLKTGGAAPDSEHISVQDLHAFVARRVAEATPDLMRPQFWMDATTEPSPLYIARNLNVRRRLDSRIVKALWSEVDTDVEWAVFRLGEIAQENTDGLAADARRILSERLAQSDRLTYQVGRRITGILETAPPAEGTPPSARFWRTLSIGPRRRSIAAAVPVAVAVVAAAVAIAPKLFLPGDTGSGPEPPGVQPVDAIPPFTVPEVRPITYPEFADIRFPETRVTPSGYVFSGFPDSGERVWRQCQACHQVGEGAQNRVGPHLNGVFDRRAAAVEGFRYSQAMQARASAGLVWTVKNLHAYLADPRGFVPGTSMHFAGIRDEADIRDLLVYLATQAPTATD